MLDESFFNTLKLNDFILELYSNGERLKPFRYKFKVTVNNHSITEVLIGRHYLEKDSSYMNDEIILQLVAALDGNISPWIQ